MGVTSYIDLTGKQMGNLTIVKRIADQDEPSGRKKVMWLCQCACGRKIQVRGDNLRGNRTKQCKWCAGAKQALQKLNNLIGKQFGSLTVLRRVDNYIQENGRTRVVWQVQCSCGNIFEVMGDRLTRGQTKKCIECFDKNRGQSQFQDLTGKTFGMLRAIKQDRERKYKRVRWICECECGNIKSIAATNLKENHALSCGCLKESYIAHEIKKYLFRKYEIILEYNIFKNPNTGCYLPYDIYIPSLQTFIEICGEQHYKLNQWHKQQAADYNCTPEEMLEYQKHKDKLKKKFAKKHGRYIEIDLLKIKTIDKAISFLEKELQKGN